MKKLKYRKRFTVNGCKTIGELKNNDYIYILDGYHIFYFMVDRIFIDEGKSGKHIRYILESKCLNEPLKRFFVYDRKQLSQYSVSPWNSNGIRIFPNLDMAKKCLLSKMEKDMKKLSKEQKVLDGKFNAIKCAFYEEFKDRLNKKYNGIPEC